MHYARWLRASPNAPRCKSPLCDRAAVSTGLCGNHYAQVRRADLSRPRCTLPGCATPISSNGMCFKHDACCRRYGITRNEFEALIVASGGLCAICEQVPTGTLHVDHDHGTGNVRGLLCSKCNFLIGQADEDVDRLMAAATYLLQFQSVVQLGRHI